jgi:hypothetical protein
MTRRFGAARAAVLALFAFAAALGVPAFAELAPEEYVKLRGDAVHHVQLRIRRLQGLPWYTDHGPCTVSGEIVRVFAGDHAVGDDLEIAVDCAKPRARLPNGAALWTSQRALDQADFIEAYLNADGTVAGWQTVLLDEASDEPACPPDSPAPC